jgi:hypothetical protein
MTLSDLREGLVTTDKIPLLFYVVGYLLNLSANVNATWMQEHPGARWALGLVVPVLVFGALAPPIVRRFLPLSPVPSARQYRAEPCQGLVVIVSRGVGVATARAAIEYHAATLERVWLLHSEQSLADADALIEELIRDPRFSARHFDKVPLSDAAFGDPEAVRAAIEASVFAVLPRRMPPEEVVVNIMGGKKETTAGAFLAGLQPGRRLEVVPALREDERLRGVTPGAPVEMKINYTLKRVRG